MRRFRAGMTIVEVLTAVAVFSLAVLVVFGTYNLTLRLNQLAREDTIATNLASETLENYRALAFSAITVPNPAPTTQTNLLPNGFINVVTSFYQNNNQIIQIQVKVYWQNRPISRAISVTTLKTSGGIND